MTIVLPERMSGTDVPLFRNCTQLLNNAFQFT